MNPTSTLTENQSTWEENVAFWVQINPKNQWQDELSRLPIWISKEIAKDTPEAERIVREILPLTNCPKRESGGSRIIKLSSGIAVSAMALFGERIEIKKME